MPPIQPLCVITKSTVKLHGRGGYYLPKGWVQSIAIPNSPGQFRVIADGEQLGEWSTPIGLWTAAGIPAKISAATHTPTLVAIVPRKLHQSVVNLSAFKRVQIEFEQVPLADEIAVTQCWIAPLNPKSKLLLFTNFYPADVFVKDYEQWKERDPLKLPTMKVRRTGRQYALRSTLPQTTAP